MQAETAEVSNCDVMYVTSSLGNDEDHQGSGSRFRGELRFQRFRPVHFFPRSRTTPLNEPLSRWVGSHIEAYPDLTVNRYRFALRFFAKFYREKKNLKLLQSAVKGHKVADFGQGSLPLGAAVPNTNTF